MTPVVRRRRELTIEEDTDMNHQHVLSPAEAYDSYLGPALFVPCARLLLEEAAPRPGETAV